MYKFILQARRWFVNPFFAIRAIGNFHLYMRPFPLIFRPPIQKLKRTL